MGRLGCNSSVRAVATGGALTALQRPRSQPVKLPHGAEAGTEVTLSQVLRAEWAHRVLSGWAAPRRGPGRQGAVGLLFSSTTWPHQEELVAHLGGLFVSPTHPGTWVLFLVQMS